MRQQQDRLSNFNSIDCLFLFSASLLLQSFYPCFSCKHPATSGRHNHPPIVSRQLQTKSRIAVQSVRWAAVHSFNCSSSCSSTTQDSSRASSVVEQDHDEVPFQLQTATLASFPQLLFLPTCESHDPRIAVTQQGCLSMPHLDTMCSHQPFLSAVLQRTVQPDKWFSSGSVHSLQS